MKLVKKFIFLTLLFFVGTIGFILLNLNGKGNLKFSGDGNYQYTRETVRRGIHKVYGDLNNNKSAQRLWMNRLEEFITRITIHRNNVLRHPMKFNDSKRPSIGKVTLLSPVQPGFFHAENTYPQLKTFTFGKNGDDPNYRIFDNTYEWICDERLYKDVTSPSKWNYTKWYPNGCERNLSRSFEPQYSLHSIHWRNSEYFDLKKDLIRHDGQAPIPTFLSVVEDGIVIGLGYVYSKGIKVAHRQCNRDESTTAPALPEVIPFHEEVFVISQFWGETVFHAIVEDITRMGPYISFLKEHTSIKIHAVNIGLVGNFLSVLGIDKNRLVSGIVHARLVYIPEGTPCGFARTLGTQMLSRALRVQMIKRHPRKSQTKRDIVIIKRSGYRRFQHHDAIVKTVLAIAEPLAFKIKIFRDDPIPPFNELALMFFNAAMVIAPHGAGLANLVLCEPGTVVIEGLCNMPHVNLCQKHTAVAAGLCYYGTPSYSGCEDINNLLPSDIAKPIKFYLPRI